MELKELVWTFMLEVYVCLHLFFGIHGKQLKHTSHPQPVRCHHCVFHYPSHSYEQCRHPTVFGGTRGYNDCEGRCYVRMDPNGYVYRGCATETLFPAINSFHQETCSYQGSPHALWWFCGENMCNSIDLMEQCQDPDYPDERYFHICDGHCRASSGSYPDPHNSSYYIQCGYSTFNEKRCDCCKQYHLRCPEQTRWEDESKQCVKIKKGLVEGKGYSYGYF